jgi:hypothetical protein
MRSAPRNMSMNQLLPIIRRVRRPLVVVDVPPARVGSVEPPPVSAALGAAEDVATEALEAAPAAPPAPGAAGLVPKKTNDGQTAPRRKAR